ncbi:hypothetical protein EON68_03975, partial [archaeon]
MTYVPGGSGLSPDPRTAWQQAPPVAQPAATSPLQHIANAVHGNMFTTAYAPTVLEAACRQQRLQEVGGTRLAHAEASALPHAPRTHPPPTTHAALHQPHDLFSLTTLLQAAVQYEAQLDAADADGAAERGLEAQPAAVAAATAAAELVHGQLSVSQLRSALHRRVASPAPAGGAPVLDVLSPRALPFARHVQQEHAQVDAYAATHACGAPRALASRSLEQLVQRIQAVGLLRERTHRFRSHKYCATGRDLVDYLLTVRQASARDEAASICAAILAANLMQRVPADKSGFEDKESAWYTVPVRSAPAQASAASDAAAAASSLSSAASSLPGASAS